MNIDNFFIKFDNDKLEELANIIDIQNIEHILTSSQIFISNDIDIKEKYRTLYQVLSELFRTIHLQKKITEKQKNLIIDLAYSCYFLDCLCGICIKINPNMNIFDKKKIIKLLNDDFKKFEKYLEKGYHKLKEDDHFLAFFYIYANFIYIFNNYSLLLINNIKNDNDLFNELWQKIINKNNIL
jgi:hypothetical protein